MSSATAHLWCIEAQCHGTDEAGWVYSFQVPRFFVEAEHEAAACDRAQRVLQTGAMPRTAYTLTCVARWDDMIPAPLSQP